MLRSSFRRALLGVAVLAGLALVFCVSVAAHPIWTLPRGAAGGVRIAKAAIEVVAAVFTAFVAVVAAALSGDHGLTVAVIRRSDRAGGKPGALHNLMGCLPDGGEFLRLCISDSFQPAGAFLTAVLACFAASNVAYWDSVFHTFCCGSAPGSGLRATARCFAS